MFLNGHRATVYALNPKKTSIPHHLWRKRKSNKHEFKCTHTNNVLFFSFSSCYFCFTICWFNNNLENWKLFLNSTDNAVFNHLYLCITPIVFRIQASGNPSTPLTSSIGFNLWKLWYSRNVWHMVSSHYIYFYFFKCRTIEMFFF